MGSQRIDSTEQLYDNIRLRKTEIHTNGTRQKAHRKTYTPIDTLSLTKEARIYNGEKTVPSASELRKLEYTLKPYTKKKFSMA